MNDIVIPEITIGFWELPMAALLMVVFLVSGMAISNRREWLKKNLWRKESLFWVLGVISIALLIPAIGHIFGLLYSTNISDLTTGEQRGFAIILAAIVGAPFVIWRTWVAQRQADTDEQGLITDRITKAVEQLGAEKTVWDDDKQSSKPNLEVRLGGIYALERIAQDSERDHIAVMEILCAYIRENSPADHKDKRLSTIPSIFEPLDRKPEVRVDIQVVLSVVGRRSMNRIAFERDVSKNSLSMPYRLDLKFTNLNGANLSRGRFAHSDFSGTNFYDANLFETDFRSTILINAIVASASFSATNLTLALVPSTDFSKAKNLSAAQVLSMYGFSSTELPPEIEEPEWKSRIIDQRSTIKEWQTAVQEAGLP